MIQAVRVGCIDDVPAKRILEPVSAGGEGDHSRLEQSKKASQGR